MILSWRLCQGRAVPTSDASGDDIGYLFTDVRTVRDELVFVLLRLFDRIFEASQRSSNLRNKKRIEVSIASIAELLSCFSFRVSKLME